MQLAHQLKPLSYLKANAAEILKALGACTPPLVITQNGETKAVLQDFAPASEGFKRIRASTTQNAA